MAQNQRVCVLGIDAADGRLVERWCAEGVVQTLDRLRRMGTWIRLENDDAFPSASVWPTLSTGTPPGRHGVVHPVALAPETLTLTSVVPEECPERPVWALLADAGARSIVVDVPYAPLVEGLDGIQIVDWAAYERTREARSWPAAGLADLVRRTGPYPVQRTLSRDPATTDGELWRDHAALLAGVTVKGAALRWLAGQSSWDFFMAAFTEAHAAGHHFWDLEFGPGASRRGRASTTPVRDVYRAIDHELANLLDVLDLTTTTLVVVSGHGMGQNVGGWQLVAPLLRHLGLLVAPPARPGTTLLRRLRAACPASVRRSVSRRLPHAVRTSATQYWLLAGMDRRRSRAFALPSDQFGFVRINRAGREPEGPVRAEEYGDLCRAIADAFRGLVDPDSGRPVVMDVVHTDEAFPGPARHRLPDLLVSWRDAAPIETVRTRDGATITERITDHRSGNHRPDGFAIVCGAGASAGRVLTGHVLDLAPTILTRFGLQPTPSMPGRSWLPPPHGDDRTDQWPPTAANVLTQRVGARLMTSSRPALDGVAPGPGAP